MDTQGIAAEGRNTLDNVATASGFLKANDQQIEATQGKLDNLFKAMGMVSILTESFDPQSGYELEPGQMAPVLRAFSDLGDKLMTDLMTATAIRGLPTA